MEKNEIKDYKAYNARMAKGLFDKAFFMNKIPSASIIVDFGCADGSLIRFCRKMFPEYIYLGYDSDEKMIEMAKTADPDGWYTSSLNELEQKLLDFDKLYETCFNFSSILHELSDEELSELVYFCRSCGPAYISIRDMYYCGDNSLQLLPGIDEDKMNQWMSYFHNQVFLSSDQSLEKKWVQFLLKYTYTENWERELTEDYFYTFERLPAGFVQYRPIWDVKYLPPHFIAQWEKDFGFVTTSFTTHRQILLTRLF